MVDVDILCIKKLSSYCQCGFRDNIYSPCIAHRSVLPPKIQMKIWKLEREDLILRMDLNKPEKGKNY